MQVEFVELLVKFNLPLRRSHYHWSVSAKESNDNIMSETCIYAIYMYKISCASASINLLL